MTTEQATAAAARLGTTAGETFRDTGLPARNPFPIKSELAAAWRRAYFAAAKPRRIRGGR